MPIELPDLDNIDYDELVSGAIAALPGYGSDWTDYNPSDPGITVLEMLAWMTEMLVYRTNRIQPATYKAFLQLLMGYGEFGSGDGSLPQAANVGQAPLDGQFKGEPGQGVRDVLLALHQRYRAVTAADYEQLALTAFPEAGQIERLTCLPEYDVTHTESGQPAALPGAISLVVLPVASSADDPWVQPSHDLRDALNDFFEVRRLVTTQVRPAGPRYVDLHVAATLFIDGDARPREVQLKARRVLFEYLHPARGGPDREGWPFGRTVRSAELMARLAEVAGVSFVEDVSVSMDSSKVGDAVALADDQLPKLPMEHIDLSNMMVLNGTLGQEGTDWVALNPEADS